MSRQTCHSHSPFQSCSVLGQVRVNIIPSSNPILPHILQELLYTGRLGLLLIIAAILQSHILLLLLLLLQWLLLHLLLALGLPSASAVPDRPLLLMPWLLAPGWIQSWRYRLCQCCIASSAIFKTAVCQLSVI